MTAPGHAVDSTGRSGPPSPPDNAAVASSAAPNLTSPSSPPWPAVDELRPPPPGASDDTSPEPSSLADPAPRRSFDAPIQWRASAAPGPSPRPRPSAWAPRTRAAAPAWSRTLCSAPAESRSADHAPPGGDAHSPTSCASGSSSAGTAVVAPPPPDPARYRHRHQGDRAIRSTTVDRISTTDPPGVFTSWRVTYFSPSILSHHGPRRHHSVPPSSAGLCPDKAAVNSGEARRDPSEAAQGVTVQGILKPTKRLHIKISEVQLRGLLARSPAIRRRVKL
jgi:hypothetical protein